MVSAIDRVSEILDVINAEAAEENAEILNKALGVSIIDNAEVSIVLETLPGYSFVYYVVFEFETSDGGIVNAAIINKDTVEIEIENETPQSRVLAMHLKARKEDIEWWREMFKTLSPRLYLSPLVVLLEK